jgi:hypothetical protein
LARWRCVERLCAANNTAAAAVSTRATAGASSYRPAGVYAFDPSAQAGCPGLNWHMGDGGALSGLITWNNMQSVARVSGGVNLQTRAFQATATEVGGQGRTAAVTGTVNPNTGWLTANIQGPNVNCQGITVPWFSPFTGGGSGR